MSSKKILVLVFISFCLNALAQNNSLLKLNFKALIQNLPLKLDSNYVLPNNDTISIETCRFYVSNIQLVQLNKTVFTDSTLAHLVDLAEPNSQVINLNISKNIKYNAIKFNIGIDSNLNVAEVLSGDLDPTKGMYWSWQSGYINFKIEGKSKKSPSRYKQFQYHLGGYLSPNNALQQVDFKIKQTNALHFSFAMDEFLKPIDISQVYQIMSPSETNVNLSKKLALLLQVK